MKQLEKKAIKMIYKVLMKYNNPVVACSWGKDSLVVLHLVKRVADKINKNFQVLWNNTGVHYPDVYKLKKRLEKEWNLDIVETKAEKTFWQIREQYGFPGINGTDRKDSANQACCYYIKKKPTKKAIEQNNWDLYFDGLTAFKSDRRYLNLKEYGLIHYHKSFKLTKCHPIGWWTVNDVWDYIENHDIPYPKVYNCEIPEENYTKRGYTEQVCGHRADRAIRNGCWCCTLAIKSDPNKMKQLRIFYPKLWKRLLTAGSITTPSLAKEIAKVKLHGQGSLFDGYFTEETTESWLNNRPCFFDTI